MALPKMTDEQHTAMLAQCERTRKATASGEEAAMWQLFGISLALMSAFDQDERVIALRQSCLGHDGRPWK